ncbi:MAG: LPS-assembly protein LptD [Stellaceae bacterium]
MRLGGLRIACLAALACAAIAWADTASAANPSRPSSEEPVLVRADELQYDQERCLTIAKGHVELDQGAQILLADAVTYNQKTDTVTASGHVVLLQPTGDVLFADFVELSDDMRNGFIKDIRVLLSDNSRLAGNTARREAGIRTEIRRAVYSPCELCKADPTRPPVWQIKAEEVVHDKELQLVEYHDATMEIDGIPIFYAPYFSHPDPSVKRASGFLVPSFGAGSNLGFHTTIPYYWAIAPDRDFTFKPMLTTDAGVVLDGEYRQRFSNGITINEASIAAGAGPQTAQASNIGPQTGAIRGHFFGNGEWDIDQNWRAGYFVQRASDQSYLLRYHFPSPTNYLTSHVYAEDFGYDHYGIVRADSFQSLNPAFGDSIEPIALPAASYEWTSAADSIGGRWQLQGSLLDLLHRTGPEVRRASTMAIWHMPFNGAIGDKFEFSASLRGDAYSADHVALTPNSIIVNNPFGASVPVPNNAGTASTLAGRLFPQLALNWRYPLVRTEPGVTALIEPKLALIAGPYGDNPARIPNEDSQGFEFDEMSLFVPNRLPGYDRVDSGQRVDYGLHGELHGTRYGDWETLVGQSYRFDKNDFFQPGSGLNDRLSDIVGRLSLTPNASLDLTYRFRFDKSDFAARRQEATVSTGPASLRASLSFIAFHPGAAGAADTSGDQIGGTISAQLTRYWSIAVNDLRSFGSGAATISSGFSATYRDDCIAVVGSVVQNGIRVGDVNPGVSVLFTLVFKNLGEVSEGVTPE